MPSKPKTPEQPKITKAIKRSLRYKFNDAELLAIGKELAEHNGNLTALEQDKKRIVADFGARISGAEASVSIAVNKIQSGYEYRDLPCTVTMHMPTTGRKTMTRDDTGEIIIVEDMLPEELQQDLLPDVPTP